MGYSALVTREYSSGKRVRRGTITKTGNAYLRRVLVEASWHYAAKPTVGPALKRRQAGLDANLVAIAWQAHSAFTGVITGWWRRASPTPRRSWRWRAS